LCFVVFGVLLFSLDWTGLDASDAMEWNTRGFPLLVAILPFTATTVSARGTPANFVIMLADDMGWGDWSRTGSPGNTPHLEAMFVIFFRVLMVFGAQSSVN
jgi:hypothetical protein